jgi:hypothetical protein
VWHNNNNDSPREEQAPLVIPEQSPVCEAISGIVGAPVVVLHLIGAKGCFVQHHSRIVERYDHMAVTGLTTLPLPRTPAHMLSSMLLYNILHSPMSTFVPHQLAFFTPGMLPARAFKRNWNCTR